MMISCSRQKCHSATLLSMKICLWNQYITWNHSSWCHKNKWNMANQTKNIIMKRSSLFVCSIEFVFSFSVISLGLANAFYIYNCTEQTFMALLEKGVRLEIFEMQIFHHRYTAQFICGAREQPDNVLYRSSSFLFAFNFFWFVMIWIWWLCSSECWMPSQSNQLKN